MSDILTKYNFDFLKNDYEIRLKFLAQEISKSESDVIVFGNPCYNLNDLILFEKELGHYNLKTTAIFFPTHDELDKQLLEALSQETKFGSHFGNSEIEVKRAFEEIKSTIIEMSNYCKANTIEIIIK